jgi:proprotein convertase subtilisin/kexin type 5
MAFIKPLALVLLVLLAALADAAVPKSSCEVPHCKRYSANNSCEECDFGYERHEDESKEKFFCKNITCPAGTFNRLIFCSSDLCAQEHADHRCANICRTECEPLCLPCDSACYSCKGPGSDQCTCCAKDRFTSVDEMGQLACTCDCPCNTLPKDSFCPQKECAEHPAVPCQLCSKPICEDCCCQSNASHKWCQACPEGQFVLNGKCVDKCPRGYFKRECNDSCPTCEKCHEDCAECTGPGAQQCTCCANNLFHVFDSKGKLSCEKCCGCDSIPRNDFCHDSDNGNDKHKGDNSLECALPECDKKTCTDCCKECNLTRKWCQACEKQQFAFDGKCIDKCPKGHFKRESNDSCPTCEKCSCDCEECTGPAADQCTKCRRPKLLYLGQCIASCPNNTFVKDDFCDANCREKQTAGCEVCHKRDDCLPCCASCNGCNGPTDDDCKCCHKDTPALYVKSRGSVSCPKVCPCGTYEKKQPCPDQSCRKAEPFCPKPYEYTCTDCCESIYVNRSDRKVTPDLGSISICLACSPHCKNCIGPDQCTECEKGYYFFNGYCYETCPNNTIESEKFCKGEFCKHPNSLCDVCKNITCKQCLACNCRCKHGCFALGEEGCICGPQQVRFHGLCYDECPEGSFLKNKTGDQKDCDADDHRDNCIACYPTCERCTGAAENQCTKCSKGKLLFEGRCLDHCPQGLFNVHEACERHGCHDKKNADNPYCKRHCSDRKAETCAPCGCDCDICVDAETCCVCNHKTVLVDGTCLSCCPKGTYDAFPEHKRDRRDNHIDEYCDRSQCPIVPPRCKPCPENCASCILRNTTVECTECKSYEQKVVCGVCVDKCENGFFLEKGEEDLCLPCATKCLTCKHQCEKCLSCRADRVWDDHDCKIKCPEGKFNHLGVCEACHPNCKTCNGSGANQCMECKEHCNFDNGSCIERKGASESSTELRRGPRALSEMNAMGNRIPRSVAAQGPSYGMPFMPLTLMAGGLCTIFLAAFASKKRKAYQPISASP